MKFNRYIILFALFFGCSVTYGQSFDDAVNDLKDLMVKAAAENDNSMKQPYIKSFSELLQKTLKQPNSLRQSFDSVPYLKVLSSDDGVLRIFNWGAPDKDGKYTYYAIIQRRMGDKNSPLSDIYVLEDTKNDVIKPEETTLRYPDWYGCLYYEILERQDMGKTMYVLMGLDFNDNISYKKYIDILTFNPQGIPYFGAPVFIDDEEGIKSRIIFEYSAQSQMYLRYHNEVDKIVFNWLHPIHPEKKDDKSYYVADITYDGFEFKHGKWVKVRNILLKRKIQK
ncbi:MAG: hypothetical protein LBR10_12630 [Prevotellaceae bacterium]|jgi:hypothetical protein|nr:hypothetical protein [Prevotellaceae bacterium]